MDPNTHVMQCSGTAAEARRGKLKVIHGHLWGRHWDFCVGVNRAHAQTKTQTRERGAVEQPERAARRNARNEEAPDWVCAWSMPDNSVSFTMPASVVNQLRSHVMSGFLLLPKRGAEVGGILLGRVINGAPPAVEITGFAPVPCEYRFGPAFILSDNDRTALEALLAGLAERPDVSIAGYFRSCTGREIALDEADEELLRAYFPGPAMSILAIKPRAFGECFAWLFHRRDGTMPAVPTHPALPFDDKQREEIPQPEPVEEFVEAPVGLALLSTHEGEGGTAPAATEAVVTKTPSLLGRPTWHWIALALMLCLATIAGYQYGHRTGSAKPPTPGPTVAAGKPAAPPATRRPPPPAAPAAPTAPVVAAEQLLSTVPALVIQQAEPDVPPGIRARIHSAITVNVEVRLDRSGKATRATAQGDGDGLYRFLADRAAAAARSSQFEPAHAADGTPVRSTITISFVFSPPPR